MSSESGQRLSMEELKQRNRPQTPAPPMPPVHPARQEWDQLLARLERLEASVGAQEALLRRIAAQAGNCPTQEQMAALARDVAKVWEELQQAGRKREISVSPPSLRTALSVLIWLALLLLGTIVGMVLLQTIWSGLSALWSVIRILVP